MGTYQCRRPYAFQSQRSRLGKLRNRRLPINTLTHNNNKTTISYIFCRHNERHKARDLVAALLRQLTRQLTKLPDDIKELYRHHSRLGTVPTCEEITLALCTVAKLFDRVVIVIDALDECEDEKTRMDFLDSIEKFKRLTNTFVTTRRSYRIDKIFEQDTWQEIYANDEDIRAYLEFEISNRARLTVDLAKDDSIKEEIETKIISKAKRQ